ncbi:MAG: carbohydrate-binding protein [Oscillospiraceae bacterium]
MVKNTAYIKTAANGCCVLLTEPEAFERYLPGHLSSSGAAGVGGADTVAVEVVDAGAEIEKTATTNGIVFTTMAEAGNIDDVTAAEHADLFSPWAYPVNYTAGQIRRYTDGKLYKCLQAHTSQADWTPDTKR